MTWSVEEQTVDLAHLNEDKPLTVSALRLWTDAQDSAIEHLGLLMQDGSALNIKFNRNGLMTGSALVPAPAAEPADAAAPETPTPHAARGRR
jgi:hypothetical protein